MQVVLSFYFNYLSFIFFLFPFFPVSVSLSHICYWIESVLLIWHMVLFEPYFGQRHLSASAIINEGCHCLIPFFFTVLSFRPINLIIIICSCFHLFAVLYLWNKDTNILTSLPISLHRRFFMKCHCLTGDIKRGNVLQMLCPALWFLWLYCCFLETGNFVSSIIITEY